MEPGEPIIWDGKIVVSCFDTVTNDIVVNTAHELPATLAQIDLENYRKIFNSKKPVPIPVRGAEAWKRFGWKQSSTSSRRPRNRPIRKENYHEKREKTERGTRRFPGTAR